MNSSVRCPPLQFQYECNLLPTYRAPPHPVTLLPEIHGVQQYVFFIEHASIKEKIREIKINKYWQENIQKTVR
jgi:hypothetical protein